MNAGPEQPETGKGPPAVSMSSDPLQQLLQDRTLDPPECPGQLACLDGYHIERTIGEGGMSLVLLGRDPASKKQVAIKMLRPELKDSATAVHRFLTEARHMQRLSHPHILPVLAVSERSNGPYFVLPFMERGSLADIMKPGKPLAEATVRRIAHDIAEAMSYAHGRGINHRDLKPGNVLMDAEGHAYLTDFGLLRTANNDSIIDVRRSQIEGTPAYMAPEVANGVAGDARCDIYSFGAMLHEMLVGQPPYEGESQAAILEKVRLGPPLPIIQRNPEASKGLAKIAEWAMARELRDRYAMMADVIADLDRTERGERPLGPRGKSKPARFRARLSVAAVLLVAALLLIVGRFVWKQRVPPPGVWLRDDFNDFAAWKPAWDNGPGCFWKAENGFAHVVMAPPGPKQASVDAVFERVLPYKIPPGTDFYLKARIRVMDGDPAGAASTFGVILTDRNGDAVVRMNYNDSQTASGYGGVQFVTADGMVYTNDPDGYGKQHPQFDGVLELRRTADLWTAYLDRTQLGVPAFKQVPDIIKVGIFSRRQQICDDVGHRIGVCDYRRGQIDFIEVGVGSNPPVTLQCRAGFGEVKLPLVLLPPGNVIMGSPPNERGRDQGEGPTHDVTISKSFYMGVTEVTQEQYYAVMGDNPSKFNGPANPVDFVSWTEAAEFCRRLSQFSGRTVRLPTEAEWEYACRAGSTTAFSFGDSESDLGRYAWYTANSGKKSRPVGGKERNAWGLHDMHGNVGEWCADWHANYTGIPATNPAGPPGGSHHVFRGGSWASKPEDCRSACRGGYYPEDRFNKIGFRVAVDAP